MMGTVKAYVALTKPRIIELLLVTTIPTMFVAQRGWPSFGLVLATLAGGTLAAGGANGVAGSTLYDIEVPDFYKSDLVMSGLAITSGLARGVDGRRGRNEQRETQQDRKGVTHGRDSNASVQVARVASGGAGVQPRVLAPDRELIHDAWS